MRLTAIYVAAPVRWLVFGTLLSGLLAALSWSSSLGQPATPAPSTPLAATPMPHTPASMGEPVAYADEWTVVVLDASTVSDIGRRTADGSFVLVELTLTNHGSDPDRFRFRHLIVRDSEGRTFEPSISATLAAGGNWSANIPLETPTETVVVFDVASDAGDSFVLESHADSEFQVEIIAPVPEVVVTPTPTPAPMGMPVTYADEWTVVVAGASITPRIDQRVADGVYLRIDLTITNHGAERDRFRFRHLVLRDSQGRTFEPSISATLAAGGNWSAQLTPDSPTETVVVFDVATDAGDSFVLESRADPSVRVHIELERRG